METHVASECLVDMARSMSETVASARHALIQKDNFEKFSAFLEKAAFLLHELSRLELMSVNSALENLNAEIQVANRVVSECTKGNRMYMFLGCERILEDLENSTKNISRAISLGFSDISSEKSDDLMKLCKDMADAKYEVSEVEEEILQRIEKGIEDRNIDRSYASDLLICIAKSIGISSEHYVLKTEFENFKSVIEGVESRTEASRMERIVLLLGNADIIMTPKEKAMKYFTKRNSLGRHLLEPLPSFCCPITRDVMEDPVETSSGHTFEKAAILKWLEEGNNFCPLTKMPLSRLSLRPNRTLQQSIEEWKNRNVMISIVSMKPEIESDDEREVLCSLTKLRDLCDSSEVHREWIVMEEYIPIIAGLVSSKHGGIRVRALAILCRLANDCDDNKERIAKVNDSITYIVRSLARNIEESVLALQLLLELSRSVYVRSLIGCVQGCILLLVTLANSDDSRASKYAREVLENLAFIDENVVQMARSKFFEPLLQRLCEGPLSMQTIMAETLANVELTDHNKLSLSKGGVLQLLLQMLRHGDADAKSAAIKALQNLSGAVENGLRLIKEGAKTPLFELLFCHNPSSAKLREHAAKTIMHLAASTASSEALEERISLIESEDDDDDVFKLFSLILYSGVHMQETLLLTFCALCRSSCGFTIRSRLRQICAVKVLVQLCELDDIHVRKNAVKLFHHLTQDGDHETFAEHVNKKCIMTLVKIIETSKDEKEMSAAMGIISHLPQNLQTSQNLFDAGALEAIFDCLTFKNIHSSHEEELLEHASQALCRFTAPSIIEWQKKVAEANMIPVLVELLAVGSPLTKRNICISLKQLSQNSRKLSSPPKRTPFFLGCCFASNEKSTCPVHVGICRVESSFCLLEARAVKPLVMVLNENDGDACEASLDVLLTLIDGVQLQNGFKVLEEGDGVIAMIKMLNSASVDLQEKILGALQRIFRLSESKMKYGKSAEISLVDITQRGSTNAKSMAAGILAQLNVLHEQSSFF